MTDPTPLGALLGAADDARFGAALGAPAAAGGPGAPYPPGKAGGYGASRSAPRGPAPRLGAPHGAPLGARARTRANGAGAGPLGAPVDAAYVIARLEEAGQTLLSLPAGGYSTRMRSGMPEIVRTAADAYGWEPARARAPAPSPARIDRMDEALRWPSLLPDDRYVLRRVLGARALVHPLTGRHLFPWRRLGTALGADHKAVQRWHAQAVDLLVGILNRS